MKEPSDFELESAVRDWRDRLSQSPQFRAENLNELEAHLRDSIATLYSQRLTDEEAFLIATRRIGCADALEPEFAKVNAREVWLNRLFWMVVGIQIWHVIIAAGRMAALALTFGLQSCFSFKGSSLESAGFLALFLVVPLMTAVILITAGYRLVRGKGEYFQRLRQPAVSGGLLAFSVVFVVLCYLGGFFEMHFLSRSVSSSAFGMLISARTLAGMVLYVMELTIPPIVIGILARRGLQLAHRSR
jgi:hypothetical protein